MSISEREWRQAEERGTAARQAGRPITACPEYGAGRKAELQREAWQNGWKDADARRKVAA
jgi:ribosome modulation factor